MEAREVEEPINGLRELQLVQDGEVGAADVRGMIAAALRFASLAEMGIVREALVDLKEGHQAEGRKIGHEGRAREGVE